MFTVSSRVSWVIIGAPGNVKMVVGMSTFSTPGGHWTGKIGVPVGGGAGRGVTENVIGMVLEKRRK